MPAAKRLQLVQAFESLLGHFDGLVALHAGANLPFEHKDHGFDHGFIARFKNAQALANYQADTRHQALGAALVQHASGGLDGIFVFDMPVNAA